MSGSTRRGDAWTVCVGIAAATSLAVLTAAPFVCAQSNDGLGASNDAEPSAADLRSAAEAYDQATRRYIRRDYAGAANYYEAADRLAPSALALMGAIRAHRQIDGIEHVVRAATLAVRLQSRYPNDARARGLAQRTLSEVSSQIGRVRVQCDGCEIEIDGVIQRNEDFFLAPGTHRVRYRWSETLSREGEIEVAAGSEATASEQRPPPPPPPPPPPRPLPFRFHPAVPITAGFVTIAFGVGAAISWADALSRANALLDAARNGNATPQAEAAVYAAEDRTTGLLVGTIVLGVATIGAGIFTRWRAPVVVPAHTAHADMIVVTGTF